MGHSDSDVSQHWHRCSRTATRSRRKYGKINHIVNNAGFTYDRMLHTTPDDAFDIIMKVHVRAPFRLIRAAAPYFRIKVRRRAPCHALHQQSISRCTCQRCSLLCAG